MRMRSIRELSRGNRNLAASEVREFAIDRVISAQRCDIDV